MTKQMINYASYFYLIFLCVFVNILDASLPQDRMKKFKIVLDSPTYDSDGYHNANANTNGLIYLLDLLEERDIVFDVGAHKGEWSLRAYAKQKNIFMHCFEPVPEICNVLRNKLSKYPTEIKQIALSNTNAQATLTYYPKSPRISTLHRPHYIEESQDLHPVFLTVNLERLDDYCESSNISKINLLKIDTQGDELNVLLGAENLLKNRSIDFIQFKYGDFFFDSLTSLKQVYYYLNNYGYTLYRITDGKLIEIAVWRESLENFGYSNYLAVLTQD